MTVNFKPPSWVDQCLDGIAPKRCRVCAGAHTREDICTGCRSELPWNTPACPVCAQPTAAPAPCRDCQHRAPAFDHALAPLILKGTVRHWVHAMKYRGSFPAARLLGQLMADASESDPMPAPDLLVPVPIHATRRWRRGFNQSEELARHLGRALNIPVLAGPVQVLRRPGEQIGQTAAQRRRNLRGAFRIDHDLSGLHVALIDDVMTTGATLDALARAARSAGAARIGAWAAARTP